MKKTFHYLKQTVFQGIIFLGPILITLIIADKIFEKFIHVINPIADLFPFHSILGIGKAYWAALLLLLLMSLLMGLLSKLKIAQQFLAWLENNILMLLPGYLFMKQMRESILIDDAADVYQVVLFSGDDGKQLAYLIEKIDAETVSIFVPDVPNPSEGNLLFVPKEKIQHVAMTYKESLKVLRSHGVGAAKYVNGVC